MTKKGKDKLISEMPENQLYGKDRANPGRVAPRRTLSSMDLFQGTREIIIEHGSQHYRLQVTKAGKLILNK